MGGKGKSLKKLKEWGFQVPAFLILEESFFAEKSGDSLQSALRSLVLENGLRFPLAVRSSANAEDGTEHSFAGMFETVLNVPDFETLMKAVSTVRESLASQRVLQYNQQTLIQELKMSVILQEMVAATHAGVLFSANPVNGKRTEMMISAVEGLGEKLVSGEVDGETIRLGLDGTLVEPGVVRILSSHQLSQLHRTGLEIALKWGRPVDVEWAFIDEQLYLLQARPITTPLLSESGKKFIFDNSNIQESYCGVTTPLTFSYASEAYCQVYNQLMKLMGFGTIEIQRAQWRHKHLLGFINGRVYYNINCWYEGLLYLPNFGRRKDDMEKMMGVEKPVNFVQDYTLSRGQKMARVLPMAWLMLKMIARFSRITRDVQSFDQWFWSLYRKYDRSRIQFLETDALVESLRQLQEDSLEKWGIPVLNDFLVMLTYGGLKREMDRLGLAEEFQTVMKGSDIVSLEPTLQLQRMAKDILKMTESDFQRKIDHFIELYGDRSMGELKLETKTYRQEPETLVALIQQMSKSEQARQPLREKMEARESDFIQKYRQKAGWFRSLSISRKIKKLKTAVEHRELMRLHRTRIFGLVRSYYLEIGSRLRDWGALRSPTDVFYLTRDEIFDCFYGKSASRDLRALVDLRMKESQEFEKIEMPAQVEVPQPVSWMMGKIEPERPAFCPSGNLKGLGCSQGKVRAKVRFVRTPQEAQNLDNCILLAERTDPGWTPLFTLVRGVIIERGSALSHSAIIAREMGIPAVVGVPGVTKILHDGDEVEIDGSSGRIEIIQNSAREARTLSTDLAVAK